MKHFIIVLIALLGFVVPVFGQTDCWQNYTVESGDTLGDLAILWQNSGLTLGERVDQIAEVNNIADANKIYEGEPLRLPYDPRVIRLETENRRLSLENESLRVGLDKMREHTTAEVSELKEQAADLRGQLKQARAVQARAVLELEEGAGTSGLPWALFVVLFIGLLAFAVYHLDYRDRTLLEAKDSKNQIETLKIEMRHLKKDWRTETEKQKENEKTLARSGVNVCYVDLKKLGLEHVEDPAREELPILVLKGKVLLRGEEVGQWSARNGRSFLARLKREDGHGLREELGVRLKDPEDSESSRQANVENIRSFFVR